MTRLFFRRGSSFVAALLAASLCAGAAAEGDPQAAEAKKQFEAGMTAMNGGDLAHARELLLASLKLVPKANTAFNLADCEERMGMFATALKSFKDGLGLLSPNDDRLPKFNQRIAALEPKVPRLRIDLASGAPEGTRVLLGGEALPSEKLGVELPLDPGKYRVTVKAPGRPDKEVSVELAEGQTRTVSAMAGGAAGSSLNAGALRTGGFVSLGTGAVGLGVFGVTGLLALDKKSQLTRLCADFSHCVVEGNARAREGAALATASTVGLVVGLAAVGAGVTLIVLGGSAKPVAVQAAVGPGGGALGLRGSF